MLSDRLRPVADWVRSLRMPIGIFVSSDSRALLVRDAVVEAGYAVGRDVGILGVDNDGAFCEMPSPSLSSIDADHREVGYRAAEWLDRLMRGEAPPAEPVLVPPRGIVVRESTDFLAVADPIVQRAMSFIRLHAAEGIRVGDIVEASFASRSVLQRRFRNLLGQSVHDVLLQEKVRRAIRLLRGTNEPIESIAEMSGFAYVQSLNKALRRLYHTSARAYRRKGMSVVAGDAGPQKKEKR